MIKAIARKILTYFVPSMAPEFYSFAGKSANEVFETIYQKNLWGGRFTGQFHSGSGSRNKAIVGPYVSAVRTFLLKQRRPSVVDLGCGDFHVGIQLIECSTRYIACDIVASLIERNKSKFKHPNLEFCRVDAIDDVLPTADVVLVRQVLQHLSNDQVLRILPKLKNFRFAIITEHIPGFDNFTANLDKDTGADHRVNFGSGLVLTEPPFNLKAKSISKICEVKEHGGIVQTLLYEFW
jgi:SAM-dependent methyltransferase